MYQHYAATYIHQKKNQKDSSSHLEVGGGEGSNCRVRFVLYGTLSACAHAAAIKLEKRTPGGSERRQGSEGADMKAVAVLVSFNFLPGVDVYFWSVSQR